MTEQGANGGKPKRSGLSKAMEIALYAVSADGYGLGDTTLKEQDFGRLRIKQWGKFARKHGLGYDAEMDAATISADPGLLSLFEELRVFGLPLNEVGGLMRGRWQSSDIVGFHTYAVGESGNVGGYRMVCAPLARRLPALIHDRGMKYSTNGSHASWYASLPQYTGVVGSRPPEKKPGLLARTPVGKKLGEIFAPLPTKLYTEVPEFAERFFEASNRQFDERTFKYNWAVTGAWLVTFHPDGQSGLMANGKASAFLDTVPLVKWLVEQSWPRTVGRPPTRDGRGEHV